MPSVRANTQVRFDPVRPRLPRGKRAKVLLVDPTVNVGSPPTLGIITLASSLANVGVTVSVKCFRASSLGKAGYLQAERRFTRAIKNAVVDGGFNIVGVTNVVGSSARAFSFAKAAKDAGALVMMGGPNVTLLGKSSKGKLALISTATGLVDVLCFGYGERAIVELARRVQGGESLFGIPGLGFLIESKYIPPRGLDTDFHLWEQEPIWNDPLWQVLGDQSLIGHLPLLASSGCRYACKFCDNRKLNSHYAARAPEAVLADLNYLVAQDKKRVVFNDLSFTSNPMAKELSAAMIKLGINQKLKWYTWGRVDEILSNPELIPFLNAAGCTAMLIGIESGNQRLLNSMRKGITVHQISAATRILKKNNIRPVGLFILGYPGETMETMFKTVEFSKALGLAFKGWHIYVPPGYAEDKLLIEGLNLDTPFSVYEPKLRVLHDAEALTSAAMAIGTGLKRTKFLRYPWIASSTMAHDPSGLYFRDILRAMADG